MSKKAFSNKGQSYYYLGKPFANMAALKHSKDILMSYFLSKKIRRKIHQIRAT